MINNLFNKTASLSLCPPQGRGKQFLTDLSTEQTEKLVPEAKRTARTFLVSLSNKLLTGKNLVRQFSLFSNNISAAYNKLLRIELNCGGEAGAKVQAVHVTPLEGVTRDVFGAI